MNPGIMFKWSCNVSRITWYKISARSVPAKALSEKNGLELGACKKRLTPRVS